MSEFYELLSGKVIHLKSANEALEYVRGERELRTHKVTYIKEPTEYSKSKIKKIRSQLGLSQTEFARIFRVTTSAVQHWKQGLSAMPAPACRLLGALFLIISAKFGQKQA